MNLKVAHSIRFVLFKHTFLLFTSNTLHSSMYSQSPIPRAKLDISGLKPSDQKILEASAIPFNDGLFKTPLASPDVKDLIKKLKIKPMNSETLEQ